MTPTTVWQPAASGFCMGIEVNGTTAYCVGTDNKIYMQPLDAMAPTSDWQPAAEGNCLDVAVSGSTIYCVGTNEALYKQELGQMSPESSWHDAGQGPCRSISISRGTIYCTSSSSGDISTQNLSLMTPTSLWTFTGSAQDNEPCGGIAVSGKNSDPEIFCTVKKSGGSISMQDVRSSQPKPNVKNSRWEPAGAGDCIALAVDGY